MAYNKKAHLRDNIEAIRLMFRLEKEQRTATPEEAGILAAYSGFGGIKAVLSPFGKLTDILRWTQADRELFPLITELHNVLRDGAADEREYRRLVESVKASTFTAFYTPPAIVNAIASSLGEHGVSPGRFLDPSSGTGNFVSAFRSQCHSASGNTPEIVAYEKDLLTGRILARLHPEAQVNIKGFEELPPHRNGYFDVVSSNIPFGDIRVFDPSFDNGTARRFALNSLHNYFFAKGLDAVREGGVLAFITSQGVMNSAMAYPVRQYLMNRSRLLSAVRLPNNLFTDYAGTEVGSDLIILQKDTLSQREYTSLERSFVEVGTQTDGTTQNEYFEHTAAIVHTRGHVGTDPYGKPARIYLHDGGMEAIAADMKYFLDRNLSEQLDLDLYLRHSPVQEFRNLVSRPAETMQQRIAQVREINRSGNMNGHSTSTDRQTIQVERRTSTPEQPSTDARPTAAKTTPEPVMSLYDLFGFTQEERSQVRKRKTRSTKKDSGQLSLFDMPPLEQHPAPAEPTPQEKERQERERQEQERRRQEEEAARQERMKPRPYPAGLQGHHRNGSLVDDDGQIGYLSAIGGAAPVFNPLDLPERQRRRASLYIEIRDTYHHLYENEAAAHAANPALRTMLNTLYDDFIRQFGNLNDRKNIDLFRMDAGNREILSLERYIDGRAVKADIFDHPVSYNINEITHTDDVHEALTASLNKYGNVDMAYMESLTDKSQSDLLEELRGRIFYNPLSKNYEIADRFISGNVMAKAEHIEEYLQSHPDNGEARISLEALRQSLPAPIPFEDLDFNFGERWIPAGVYSRYASWLFDTDVSVRYTASSDEYSIRADMTSPRIMNQYSVRSESRIFNGIALMRHAIHNTTPNITKTVLDKTGKEMKIRDPEVTLLANSKIDEIRNGFSDWLMEQSPEFKRKMADMYNRKFNCFVRPKYDGSHQSFPGLDLKGLGIPDLYPSQKDCIWMLKQNGGGIADHEVGGGKTLIMCCAAYEMKRLGLANKPLITGLKANIHEIAQTFATAYPNAKVLYPGKEDFTPENRLRIFSDIKNNNWDCIILTHEQFGKIPQSAEVQQQILRQEMDDIDENLASYEKQGGHVDGWILRGLEKRKENLDAKLHELQETIDAQKDDTVDFQQMGIDHLFVDESHNFKNLMFNTRHSRVSGLGNTDGSKKAMNLLYAIRTIQQRTGRDLGATFLSGTTIANSLTELYLLFKYLRPKELERQDIPCFDAWAAVFAQKTSEFEFSVTNEVISKERFRYFIKVPELAMFYNEITDYRTAADVGIDRPELDEELCQIPMTDDQQAFLDKLVLFAKTGDPEHIGRADLSDGEVKALMLLVTMYSNKLSLDMRLISPAYADSPGNKASRSAANIAEYYRRYEDQKGTQMVFCDLSTYKPGIWNVYSEIKRKLVEDHGIPAQEIRFVQEAASDKVRQAMFDAMNEGKIRVLFGSTQKLGTGVNAQKRIVCMHHLDIPWRPMDLEQRNGRGARKGNIVAKEYAGNKVKAYVYAVLRTLDAYKLNLLHNKQQFIDQLKRNRLGARRLDEGAISEDSGMNFAEWMAVVSGNTDLLQKAKLEGRIAALESEQTIFMRTRHEAQSQLQRYTAEIGRRDAMLERLKRDWDYINEVAPPDAKGKRANPLRIDGVESADIVAHGKRLVEIDRTVNTGDDYQKIGTLFDFRILVRTERMQKDGLALTVNKFMVEGLDGIKYTFNNGHLAAEPKTAATNFIRALDTIPSLMATYEKEKKQFTRDIPTFEQQIAAVWPKEEELKRLKAEAESLTRKIQLDIAQKQQEMQAKTADNGNGLKIENAEVVDEVVKPSKAEPLSTASESQEEPPEEREHVVSPPESDFIRNHILLVRPATNVKAKGPKL